MSEKLVFLGAYPRSGSTWVKFLLYEALSGEAAGFENSSAAIPHVGAHRRAMALLPGGQRLIKTHERYRPKYRKAVYIVRDARDVLLSEYAFLKWRGLAPEPLDQFIRRFLDGQTHGYGFGSWADHTKSWLQAREMLGREIHIERYEDLREEPVKRLMGILDFLGVSPGEESIQQVVANNQIRAMQSKEDAVRQTHAAFRKRERSYTGALRFVRKGSLGAWREELSPEQQQVMHRNLGDLLVELGYE